jgi:hypothetical protein
MASVLSLGQIPWTVISTYSLNISCNCIQHARFAAAVFAGEHKMPSGASVNSQGDADVMQMTDMIDIYVVNYHSFHNSFLENLLTNRSAGQQSNERRTRRSVILVYRLRGRLSRFADKPNWMRPMALLPVASRTVFCHASPSSSPDEEQHRPYSFVSTP